MDWQEGAFDTGALQDAVEHPTQALAVCFCLRRLFQVLLGPGFHCWVGQQVSGESGWLRSLMDFRESHLFWKDEYGSDSLIQNVAHSHLQTWGPPFPVTSDLRPLFSITAFGV